MPSAASLKEKNMKTTKHLSIIAIAFAFLLSSCDLLQGDGNSDPNVNEDDFLNSSNAMKAWVAGCELQLSQAVGSYTQLLEILSDNYYNNYSRSSNVFDQPQLLNTDDDVKELQRWVGTLRESVDYAFNTVAKYDNSMTQEQHFQLDCIKAYAFILGGETFTGLPVESGGEVKSWKDNLHEAATLLNQAIDIAPADSDRAFVQTLLARTYYRLGDRKQAVEWATKALGSDASFVRYAYYDGDNAVSNIAQEAIWSFWFQPLPRLDFLDPKYFQTNNSNEQRPICIAKAEENYLILAEAAVAEGSLDRAKDYLRQLLALVGRRPVARGINDAVDNRYNGGTKHYPASTAYRVRASADDPYRSGLVHDHSSTVTNANGEAVANYIVDIPYVSGTSVDSAMIDAADGHDSLLELVYLMRQEIFFAEGRRVADLGIRLPVSDVEAANTPSASGYTDAVVPQFIPLNGEMDAFDMDEAAETVTIHYNMNRVIVTNRKTDYVVPFE